MAAAGWQGQPQSWQEQQGRPGQQQGWAGPPPGQGPQHWNRGQQRKSWPRRHPVLLTFLIFSGVLVLGVGGCTAILGAAISENDKNHSVAGVEADKSGDTTGQNAADEGDAGSGLPDGVYRFGSTVKFGDGSTLQVGKPVKFKRDEFAAGGEDFKHAVKVKLTFTNGTKKTFDPTLTTGNITSGDREGDSIFQDGLDAPDNKILPGRKITWWMGYGVDNPKDLTLDVSVGFLDYDDVIFTNSKSAP